MRAVNILVTVLTPEEELRIVSHPLFKVMVVMDLYNNKVKDDSGSVDEVTAIKRGGTGRC